MKILLILLILISISVNAFADKIIVPFECYPDEIVERFEAKGYQLEPHEYFRDENSWGFLKNEGSQYTIYTYKPVTKEELEDIRPIIMGWENG